MRSPFIVRQVHSGTVLRGTAAEAKRGAKALLDLQDEIEEDAAGNVHPHRAKHPQTHILV